LGRGFYYYPIDKAYKIVASADEIVPIALPAMSSVRDPVSEPADEKDLKRAMTDG
jgi:hypothetical protein